MNLVEATALATELCATMAPFCHRVDIAGSIRRKTPQVKDIELVAIPKWANRPSHDLFQTPVSANLLHEWAVSQTSLRWIKPGTPEIVTWPVKSEGKYWRGLSPKGIKLDLFLANETNWGVIFAIRTGSAEFSEGLVTHARFKTPYIVEGGFLRLVGGEGIVVCREESVLFQKLNLVWVEPEKRTGRGAVIETSN
jgi:DNA polymerase/3'-5' exonuclease PolX